MNENEQNSYVWPGTPAAPRKKMSKKGIIVLVVCLVIVANLAFFGIAGVGTWIERRALAKPERAVKEFVETDAAFRARYEGEEWDYDILSVGITDGVFRAYVTVDEDEWTFYAEQRDGTWVVTRYKKPVYDIFETGK